VSPKKYKRQRGRGSPDYDEIEDDDDRETSKRLTDDLRDRIESWAREAAEAHGLQLFDVEPAARGRWIVRVYVERPGDFDPEPGEGVEVDECAEVSRYLEAYLDAEDAIPENYVLEVSSPGLERPLTGLEDLERAIGNRIQLVTREQIDGRNKVVGTLEGLDGDVLEIEIDGRSFTIDWDDVKQSRLKRDFSL
jgi:ribosome maturation factor RimP